jgi:integrase
MHISRIIVGVTARHVGDLAPRGFSPHAMRHIIATHLVKVYHEEGILRAAAALHNTPEMIRKHYQHLTAENATQRSHELINSELTAGRERIRET